MGFSSLPGFLDLSTRFVILNWSDPVNVEIHINIEEYNSPDELPAEEQQLIEKAIETAHNAYAPYSEFRVGACLLLEDGTFVAGNNQENAAYPDGLCAERVAMFAANAMHPEFPIIKMAIAAVYQGKLLDQPVYPCGSCRQALLESENRFNRPARILMFGQSAILAVNSIKDLLPLSFDSSFLKFT